MKLKSETSVSNISVSPNDIKKLKKEISASNLTINQHDESLI